MQITRVLNTNAVLSADSDSNEIVLLGRGIGFKARPGDNVDETKIEKRFTLNDKKQLSRFRELLEQIPSEYIFVAEQAISFAKRFYNLQLNESIHISLADHLHSAVENAKLGIQIPNSLLLDIKQYYPREYEIGQQTITFVDDKLHIKLPEDEWGFVAMHFVNAQYGKENTNVKKIITFVRDVNNFILNELDIKPDEDSKVSSAQKSFGRYKLIESRETGENGALLEHPSINAEGFEFRRISHEYSFRLS